ncbi:uncharacterized protein N7511_003174 [Penicillium nucicola]|uniref:uncharacterized protein n=1 Tax=Penicillium nucicola TaxID=1850975 RepID=UPI00254544CE|nr:uncharacterized protein N7511_003174 [Penicillium nucicola]KAJ5771123.1 hypothetical protein N7511_003174 [Penicillium nucicola]
MLGLVVLCCVTTVFAKNTRFLNFFPVYRNDFLQIRDGPCAAEFALKQSGAEVCWSLLNCMLENTSEAIKGDMGSGIVALGLGPTILTFLGSGTAETSLLARRRPLLALLIASGSPAVNPLPTFVYPNPIEELKSRDNHLAIMHFSSRQAVFVSILEYVLVMGAIANVYTTAFYMGSWTINTISCDDVWYPALWAVTTLFIHIFGSWCLALRVNTPRKNEGSRKSAENGLGRWIRHELSPCITHDKLELIWKPESYLFVAISWWTSLLTVVHLLYGTIAFSSIQFIGYVDSIQIIARFMGSAVVCRAILMLELAGMRNALKSESSREEYSLVQAATATLSSGQNSQRFV